MRCVSCGGDIPAQWVSAIQKNECPGCGKQIMSDESQTLLHELSDAIKAMPNDPQGLAGWLMSNYRMKKIGDAEPAEKFFSPNSSNTGQKLNTSSVDDFLARTHIKDIEGFKNIKDKKMQQAALAIADFNANEEKKKAINEQEQDPEEEDLKTYNELMKKGIDPFHPQKKALSIDQIQEMQEGLRSMGLGSSDREEDVSNSSFTEDEIALMNSGPVGQKIVKETRLRRIRAQQEGFTAKYRMQK